MEPEAPGSQQKKQAYGTEPSSPAATSQPARNGGAGGVTGRS